MNNTLARYAIGLLVTLIVLLVVALVGGAFAGAITDESATSTEYWTESEPHDPDATIIELEDYGVEAVEEVVAPDSDDLQLDYEYDNETNEVDYEDHEDVEEGDSVEVRYEFYPEDGDEYVAGDMWTHEDDQDSYETEHEIESVRDVYVMDSGESVEYSQENESTISYDFEAVESGDELAIEYVTEYDVDEHAFSEAVSTVVEHTGTAMVIFGVSILVLPAVAVIVLIVSGFGGMMGRGRGGR
ncbi:hypothetical protein AArcMg_0680 [Natrarchaeobaculum sulfurireducens]|uniref:Uncharacterized protein n=1 Tax=Natrarchaeobaculum sulfurireducens TaxID=2044521 RepID=A0A346PMF7_9EURY|nr:hypothetical protein AArcMg_0680 [Natrarchaeobaculum sulfurireducens]